jgi:hypothetical protein
MKAKLWVVLGPAAIVVAGLAAPLAAEADSKTVVEQTPGTYVEKHKGDDGDHTYKETNRDGKIVSQYRGKDCKQDTVRNLATGEVKVVTKGDCDEDNDKDDD